MKVVIVESPAKAKTINKYLGKDYGVYASFGHVRDLAAKDGSVDPDDDFAMRWEVDAKAAKRLSDIGVAVKTADRVILATDPDREGEAISWHIHEILKSKKLLKDKRVDRVVFNAVTKDAVQEAMRHPREIDEALVDAYRARRALDYLVGFNLSPVLWRKLPGARSAGRVQSVALRIVCDRELEIEKFVAREYWSIIAHLRTEAKAAFTARLVGADGKKINRLDIGSGAEAEAFKTALEQALFSVAAIRSKPVKRHPYPPVHHFDPAAGGVAEARSRAGAHHADFPAPLRRPRRRRRRVASSAYMRTDGVDLAPEAVASARRVIAKDFGDNYVPSAPRKYTAKAKNAQEAHEAIRPTDMTKRPRDVARHLEPEQAKLYELIWTRTIACQMESAELERTTVDILAEAGARKLEFRATGQVVRFPGFLALYQEGRDDEEDEESSRLPAMRQGEKLAKERIEASQHFTEPPPRYTEATLVKRMEELGIGRPSTYASTIAVLKDRDYVRIEKKRLFPEDKGRIVTAFLESFFAKYVGYDFTADLEEKLDQVSNSEIDWKALLRDFWNDFSGAVTDIKDLGTRQVLDSLNEVLGPHIFPARGDGVDPRLCPLCGEGQLSLKLGKYGAFIGCSRYPECKFSRVLAPSGAESSEGDRPGVRVLGQDPTTGEEITLRNGRFGEYIQQGEGEKPKRSSLPKGLSPDDVTLEKALALLALPREVARHPTSGEAILAGIGRYGAYVQHGKTYANLGRDDDVLEIGGNRAIDLIVAKESGAGGSRFGAGAGRELGEHPDGGKVSVKSGRFGSYVNHGKINATIQKGTDPASLTLAEAVELLKAKAAGGGVIGRLVGEHPDGGPVTVRDGRFGAYVNWAKVNATIPRGTAPDSVTLPDALELIAEREGKPAAQPRKTAKKAPARGKVAPTKPAVGDGPTGRAKSTGAKKANAKKAAPAKPKSAAASKRG